MKKGKKLMQILKIEDKKGYYYSFEKNEYIEINNIGKNDLLELINHVLKDNETTYDEISETNTIDNKAQCIVYKSVSEKIASLIEQKESIMAGINAKYKDAMEKYSN